MVRTEGGGKILNTNCRYSDFVVSLSRKKGFLMLFLIVFYFIFLLFDFIAMLLPIHHCLIYCLMMTTCGMKHKCGHYCIQMFFLFYRNPYFVIFSYGILVDCIV